MPLAARIRACLVAAALGLTGVVAGVGPGEASAATAGAKASTTPKKSPATKAKAKKKSTSTKSKKRPTTTQPAAAPPAPSPQLRAASGPAAIGDDELDEGEGEGDEVDAPLDAEAEYDRVEAEILREQARGGEVAPPIEPEPEPAPEPVDDTPVWVEHEVIPGDTVDSIAVRYDVPTRSLIKWNKLDPKKPRVRVGKAVRVHAVRPPPPRERREVELKKGDTWEKIAGAQGVDVKLLQRWNPPTKGKDGKKRSRMIAGGTLTVWVEPEAGAAAAAPSQARLLAAKVRGTGVSVGTPTRGRLVNGVELPDNPELYTRRKPEQSYGSSHTIRTVVAAIAEFRRISGYTRELVIGAISLPRGGRFRPHRSHQSGRDVDIRLPVLRAVDHHNPPRPGEVDWRATWRLIDAFVESGEVQYIFLDYRLQRALYKAAREAGVPKQRLAEVLQWPRPAKSNNGVVRHAAGHTSHIHVRVKCGGHEKHCQTAR